MLVSSGSFAVIVIPVVLFFLLYEGSAAYLVVMIKVASLGQQVENDHTRAAGRSLLASTFWGGLAALIAWGALSAWPSLILYVILIALAGLWFGRRIFKGQGMDPLGGMWGYAFLTMLAILAPAVLDSPGGDAAGVRFQDRFFMMAGATVYAVAAVYVFDAFWRGKAARTVVE